MNWSITGGRGTAAGLMAGTALALSLALPVQAREMAIEPEQLAQAGERRIRFDIPAQPLPQAMNAFGRQAGMQVTGAAAVTAGVQAQAVSGDYTAGEALARLLAGTGISFSFSDDRTVVLEKIAAEGAMTLDPVTVEGAAPAQMSESAYGPVQGYVAKRTATGTKTDTPIIEVPQSISVVTREQMEAQGVRSLEQALAYTPGVMVSTFGDDPRYDQFNLRGFTGNTTAMYLDGLRQWGAVFNYPQNDPYTLEKIGVIRGPASVLYGQVAPGGLVEAVSKRPTETPLHEVSVLGGSNDLMQGQFDFSGALDKEGKFLYRATGLARDADAEIEGTDDNRRFFAPAVTWRPNGDTSLTLLAQYQQYESTGWPYYYASGSNVSKIWVGDPNYNEFSLDQFHVGYQFSHKFNDTWQVRQNFRYGRMEHDSRYIMALNATGNTLSRYAGVVHQSSDTYALDNQAQADFSTGPARHTLLFGAGYDRMHYNLKEGGALAPTLDLSSPSYGISFSDPAISEQSRQTQQQVGVYTQDQLRIGKVALTLGGRWDHATNETKDLVALTTTDTTDSKFTGKAGVVYLFDNGLAPYVSYSESFLPTSGTDYYKLPFKPTTGQQKEVGIKFQPPGHNSFVTVALYDLVQQNVLTRDPVHTTSQIQTGEVQSRGFEVEAKAEIIDGLNLIGAYSYTDAEVTKSNTSNLGKVPVVTPRHTASAWVDYTLRGGALEGFGIGSGVRYVGHSYGDSANTVYNDSYFLVDAMVRYDLSAVDPDLQGIQASLNVGNLFDKEVSTCNSGGCNWLAGRNVIGKLTYRW